ncbi:protease SohB [Stutzerimonas kirkiae]|uniref:Protease SohB n=1 Tax=Stutzerimonas kirkiae TaxID=2211392 RepID=A0A4Q9R661_9GAMM|nr:protease SohB [Stutzerimonas kirkiae]TBU96043.1 protease SohB [Stutzerimonas kirkiae]TBV03125.1 protease SohB [Stutzerimonas kirkiae]TBV09791.1 protease SohB [Stutzerimonas kirkiae]TBV13479.1 protease SohB [Stutzerimonas kirkiae]
MEFLADYAGFLARTLTVVVAIIAILIALVAMRRARGGQQREGELEVRRLNDFYKGLRQRLEQSVLEKDALKALRKQEAKAEKALRKEEASATRVFVLDFDGDIKASALDNLRHEVTAILTLARPVDEVVVRLESAGGMVHAYGLAASQLVRIRSAGVPLTICVDKVAASGGYMMACIGEKILAAPFAILGSIGVVAQLPNLHRLLQKHDVDFEVLTAGEYKRTLTVFGENTEKGREKFQEDLETTHELFKGFVAQYRQQLSIDEVATGEVWLGSHALALKLVDEISTSDEYLAARAADAQLFHVHYAQRKSLPQRFGLAAATACEQTLARGWSRLNEQRFWQ